MISHSEAVELQAIEDNNHKEIRTREYKIDFVQISILIVLVLLVLELRGVSLTGTVPADIWNLLYIVLLLLGIYLMIIVAATIVSFTWLLIAWIGGD